MKHIYADDGRIITTPQELEPLLKGSFPAFIKTLGHIRFYYMADEIWDGKSALVFKTNSESFAAIILSDSTFYINIAGEDFQISDETLLEAVYEALRKNAAPAQHRPAEQLTVKLNDPNQFPCGRRCDLCLGSKKSENFGYLNWLCYHNCVPGIDIERWDGVFNCPGCVETRKTKDCKYFPCPTKKGYDNCMECGEYHSCDVYRDCHYPGQCNLGLTAEEVTSLVMPYCSIERFDCIKPERD